MNFWASILSCSKISCKIAPKISWVTGLLFNDDQNKKRGRTIKTLEDHVLEGKSADDFFKEALNKRKKDMVCSGRNHSM